MEFLPTVIFFPLFFFKTGIRAEFFFKLDFYYLFVYSTAVVFFIQVLCFCLTLVLAISVITQEFCCRFC